jgi:hypothetical protein
MRTTRAQLVDHKRERLHAIRDIHTVVNVHREVHPFVPQNIRDDLRMNSRATQFRRERVTKIVPSAKRDAQFLSSRSDVALQSVADLGVCRFGNGRPTRLF